MSDTYTTYFGWDKPQPGGSAGTWGAKINSDFDSIDSILWSVSGGVFTGHNYSTGNVANVILTNTLSCQQEHQFNSAGYALVFPAMNVAPSPSTSVAGSAQAGSFKARAS